MATRFYFQRTTAAQVSPAYDSAWLETSSASRYLLVATKGAESLQATSLGGGTDQVFYTFLRAQWVSPSLTAQTIASQAIKAQFEANEPDALNNNFLYIMIRVVSSVGVHKSNILALTADDVELAVTTSTNRQFTATTTEQTLVDGDRLVIEVGHGGTNSAGGTHSGSVVIGNSSGTDLPEDDTTQSALTQPPWLEFGTLDFTTYQPPLYRSIKNKSLRPAIFTPGRAV